MIVSLIILCALLAVGSLLYLLDKRSDSGAPPSPPAVPPSGSVGEGSVPVVTSAGSVGEGSVPDVSPAGSIGEGSVPAVSPTVSVGEGLVPDASPTGSVGEGSVPGAIAPGVDGSGAEEPEVCCGLHLTCEKDSLLADVSDRIEYFDDEELDRFAGRLADGYSPAEIDEFRDVLMTLIPSDISPWARSIQLRGITLPTEIREELLFLVAENRLKK